MDHPRATPISMACIGNRSILLKKDELSDSTFNSTSAAMCIELSMIVTELGQPHIIRSDAGPCHNSKEFQQFLQCYSITHQTSSPNHPRSNGFIERMVGFTKKLMDKDEKEGKLWISGLFDCRVTPQSGSIASPLQLMTQHTSREKNLP